MNSEEIKKNAEISQGKSISISLDKRLAQDLILLTNLTKEICLALFTREPISVDGKVLVKGDRYRISISKLRNYLR